MQHVKKAWIQKIIYFYAGVCIAILAGYIYMQVVTVSDQTRTFWGITTPVAIFCSINAIYLLVVFPFASKRNLWMSTVFGYVLMGLLPALLIETSQQTNNLYRVLTSLSLALSASTGVFIPIAGLALVWLLYIFTLLAVVSPSQTSLLFYTAWNLIHSIASVVGWALMRKHYVRDDTRDLVKISGMLEEEQFKASVILESITDGVLVINAKGTVQLINHSASAMLGWSAEEAKGIDFHNLMTPVQEGNTNQAPATGPIDSALKDGQAAQHTALFKTRAKDNVYFDILASPIRPGNTPTGQQAAITTDGVIVVFRDVSAARAEEKAKADFISTASHEMRTPVAAIEGYLALALNDKVSNIDAKAREYLTKAHENTQHLGELFQDLLTTTKAEDGRLVNNPELVEMSSFLRELTNDLRFVAEKKGLTVNFVASGTAATNKVVAPLYYALVDPTRIQEVVTNLFDNAVKYTESGSITIGISGDQSVIQCYIADTGHGIPADDVKHLFQKFYRVDNSVTRTIGGTGLGLFICRKIVELYGGRIWVESKVGEGSKFYINIPRMTSQQVENWKTSHPETVAAPVAPPMQTTPVATVTPS